MDMRKIFVLGLDVTISKRGFNWQWIKHIVLEENVNKSYLV